MAKARGTNDGGKRKKKDSDAADGGAGKKKKAPKVKKPIRYLTVSDLDRRSLRNAVRGFYDIQKLRIESGNRLAATFGVKMGLNPGEKLTTAERAAVREAALADVEDIADRAELALAADDEWSDEMFEAVDEAPKAEAAVDKAKRAQTLKMLADLKAAYNKVTEGIVENVRRLTEENITLWTDGVISTFAEYSLIDQWLRLVKAEADQLKLINKELPKYRVWNEYLKNCFGVGPTLGAFIIAEIDIRGTKYVSSLWRYCGLDVVSTPEGGEGRGRFKHHLVERTYIDKNGKEKTKMGLSYKPALKSKLLGVLGPQLLRKGSPWRETYDGYKHRISTTPGWGKTAPGCSRKAHINKAAVRYTVKQWLKPLYENWRPMEGCEVFKPYNEAKQGARPHSKPVSDGKGEREVDAA